MKNIVHVLPDAIANQIAAGEVVQRPASVVKELLENAVDAGATRIDVFIKDAGKALIQVSDNGSGMSAHDARMSFERHATSKIRDPKDLFQIQTLGFRGEALASIAAVAQVKLKTKLTEEELGVEIDIEASAIKRQDPCAMASGTTFQVKNLFFNVPARRNFLKSNTVETRHLMNEFIRVALPNPQIHMSFRHNDTSVFDLAPGTVEDRIVGLLGKEFKGKLSEIEEATGYVKISGFVGSPEIYRKHRGDQFFFVNNRFIKSNYLHHSIANAYQESIPKESHPFYCIFLEIDPVHVDINIHPTKTEVKFDDERTLYALLQSIVKRSLGTVYAAPEFDFSNPELATTFQQDTLKKDNSSSGSSKFSIPSFPPKTTPKSADWDSLYAPEKSSPDRKSISMPEAEMEKIRQNREQHQLWVNEKKRSKIEPDAFMVQFQQRYILTHQGEQLIIIDQHLAHQRILFEKLLKTDNGEKLPSQQMLFPQTLEFAAVDFIAIREVEDMLINMGFEVKEFGRNSFIVYGTPAEINTGNLKEVFEQIVADVNQMGTTRLREKLFERIARAVAMRTAVTSRHKLSMIEMKNITQDLFACEVPGFAPNGKPTFKSISEVELEEYFR